MEINDLKQQLKIKEDKLHQIDDKHKQLYEENVCLKKDKEKLEKEKDEALSRLSKLAGQRLTNDNPNITDLGDPNRPVKIGERWSSLYSDEWTDAYEAIKTRNKQLGNDESEPEKQLLQLVDCCYLTCKGILKQLDEVVNEKVWDLVRQIHFLGIDSSNIVPKERLNKQSAQESQILFEAMQPFKEIVADQRRFSPSLTQIVFNKCYENYSKSNPNASSDGEKRFVKKCSELCWFICTTEPPMFLEYKDLEDQQIDGNKFKHYNRTGKTVQFVIWPVLLLYKNGPVLAKGVVQTHHEVKSGKKILTDANLLYNNANGTQATTDERSSQGLMPQNEHCDSYFKCVEMKADGNIDDVLPKPEETSVGQPQLHVSETSDGGHQLSDMMLIAHNGKQSPEISVIKYPFPDAMDVMTNTCKEIDKIAIQSTVVTGNQNQSVDHNKSKMTVQDISIREQPFLANAGDKNDNQCLESFADDRISLEDSKCKQHSNEVSEGETYSPKLADGNQQSVTKRDPQSIETPPCDQQLHGGTNCYNKIPDTKLPLQQFDGEEEYRANNLSEIDNVELKREKTQILEESKTDRKTEGDKYENSYTPIYSQFETRDCVLDKNDKYEGDLSYVTISKEQTNNKSLNNQSKQEFRSDVEVSQQITYKSDEEIWV